VLKIENEIEEIPQSVGVRQGDNMAPVLFLFLMTAFAQTLELEWKKIDIPILSVMTAGDEHLADGKICSHTPKMVKSKKLTTYEILQCLYVNDGAFPFDTREDMQRGMELIYHHFARFGLEMHIGRGTSESKTECVFSPPPQFFQRLERTNTAATTIQRAFRRKHHAHSGHIAPEEEPPQDQQASFPTTVIHNPLSPMSFPIGCRVTVTPSHVKHANTNGTVTRHTAKFVEFVPDNCHSNTIRILPKSLTITLPPPRPALPLHPVPTRRPDNALHFMPLTTTKRGLRDNENKTTLHMTTLPRQQKSLSPTDLSASHTHFATWVLSSIIVSVTTTTSRQESRQPLQRWVH
jgi:hypothetical protein